MGCAGVARDCVRDEWYRLAAKYVIGGGVRYRSVRLLVRERVGIGNDCWGCVFSPRPCVRLEGWEKDGS